MDFKIDPLMPMRKTPGHNNLSILFISPLPPPAGGIATWTQKIKSLGLPNVKQIAIVDTRIKGKRNIFERATFSLIEIVRFFSILIALLFHLTFRRPSVVHLNSSLSTLGIYRDLFCGTLTNWFGIPFVCHYHGHVSDFLCKAKKSAKSCCKRLSALAHYTIVGNQGSLESVKSLLPVNKHAHLFLLPNFIEDDLFLLEQTRNIPSTKPLKILFAGGITTAKGCYEILELAKLNPNMDFHLYGKLHEDMAEALQDPPKNLILNGVVSQSQLYNAMACADILLFPSHTEGFPLTILEAMAFGLPVIATPVGAIPEMINEGLGGYLCPVRDITAINLALRQLATHSELREHMGKHNKSKCFQEYRYSIVAKKLTQIYLSALQEAVQCAE